MTAATTQAVAGRNRVQAPLWYAVKLQWPVAPAYHILPNGGCSCGETSCSSPGKHPRTKNGFKDASTEPGVISQWWSQYPEANVIVPTGGATGLLVLDIDPDHGGNETLAVLEAEHGPLPDTMEQITGSGGRHLLFKSPGPEYGNTIGQVGRGIDSRGDGGYIIVAPSNHKSGNVYRWRDGHKPGQIEIAEAPSWLLGLLKKGSGASGNHHTEAANGSASIYAETAFADEVKATATAPEGTRNNQLNNSALSLGQLVGAGFLDRGRVERSLTDAALSAGLSRIEAERTLHSGLEAGIKQPREIPNDRPRSSVDVWIW